MKKLLLILFFTLTTLFLFGQEAPFYVRAESFQLGNKDSNLKVTWDTTTYKTCDVLIKLEEKEVTIYSKTIQTYHVISFDGKMDNGASRWYCSDLLGRTCNIYLMDIKTVPGYLSLTVEFSDYVWYYICKITK